MNYSLRNDSPHGPGVGPLCTFITIIRIYYNIILIKISKSRIVFFIAVYLDTSVTTLADNLVQALLSIQHDILDHSRHLQYYFTVFYMYASMGLPEKAHLLKVNTNCIFIFVARIINNRKLMKKIFAAQSACDFHATCR